MTAWLAMAIGLLAAGQSQAEEASVPEADAGVSEVVTSLIRSHLPDEYEKRKGWGRTTELWDGLHLGLDGVRLQTKRKKRTVNHGTWTMYRVRLQNPDEFAVQVANIRRLDDGRAAFDAEFSAPLDVFGRLSQWERGVQLISLSADCEARVRLQTSVAVRLRLDRPDGKLLPDVILEPEVLSAELVMESFRLRRLSQLSGPLAKHLGSEAREVIEDELAERNAGLAAKLNKQLAKKQDKLRLSLSDLANSKWGDLTKFVGE